MKLAAQVHGEGGDRPPLLVAHGLFGSARNWGVIAKRLAGDGPVVTVDMRNHGDSPWSDVHDYPAMAEDLAEAIQGRWDMLGHSMGGKAAMVMALTRPDKVDRLIVADIAPVAYSHTQAHLVAAMEGLDLAKLASRAEADAALSATVADPGVRAFLLQSLDLRERRWRLNLGTLGAEMAKILSFPETLGRFDGPALFLSGGTSPYVLPEHREPIKALFPAARFAKIPGAGHWLHAEKPREFEAAVRAFLART